MQIYLIELNSCIEANKLFEDVVFDIDSVKKQKNPQKRDVMLCARALVMYALFRETGIKFTKDDFRKTDKGKPYVLGDIHFNVSHSENVIVCAVDSYPLGIDIEKITYRELVAKRFFTQSEQRLLNKHKEKEFTKIWTKKEALAKLTGESIFSKTKECGCKTKTFRYKDFYITVAYRGC